jgi:hypothetical protein
MGGDDWGPERTRKKRFEMFLLPPDPKDEQVQRFVTSASRMKRDGVLN